MTRDATRRPGQEPQRHAVGITRTCLASGTMQLPFALAGTLPQGELLVHDAEAGEPLVLWSEPPRRLAGLAPFFEHHDLHVNDSVVLEIDGDEIRLMASKRPRRSRPVVQPSTWTSLHDAPATPVRDDAGDAADDAGSAPAADAHAEAGLRSGGRSSAPHDEEMRAAERRDDEARGDATRDRGTDVDAADVPERPVRWTPRGGFGAGDEDAASAADTGFADTGAPEPAPSDTSPLDRDDAWEMPQAPRVSVKPVPRSTPSDQRPLARSETMPERGGPFSGLRRFARSIFGGGGGDDAARSRSEERREAPDWTQGWDAADEEAAEPSFEPVPEGPDDAWREVAQAPAEARRRPVTERVPEPTGGSETPPEPEAITEPERPADIDRWDDHGDEDKDASAGWSEPAPRHEPEPGNEPERWDEADSWDEAEPWDEPEPWEEPKGLFASHEDDDASEVETGTEPPAGATRAGATMSGEEMADVEADDAEENDVATRDAETPDAETPDTDDGTVGPTPLFPQATPPRGPVRRPVDETPSGVPPRAERFLGGDLRTRLLRYLASPEMGTVAKVERIAKRFDLDEATTEAMLADIADDPPEGLRLRSVREGAWRIERTLNR